MEDFLKGREVISRTDRPVDPVSTSTLPPLDHAPPPPKTEPAPTSQETTGEHGTRVESVVERGRVTRLIVTCACGTVTEIECQY